MRKASARSAGSAPLAPVSLALLAIVLVLYLPALRYDFVFDDGIYVTSNRMVARGLTLDGARWALTTLYAGHWHPVTWFSHMIDVALFGLRPAGHHATSIALHALNSVLVFLVLAAATRRRARSAVAAALFAVHPLHVESAAWVADRKDLLAACFWLLAMLVYQRWTRRRDAAGYLAVFLLFFMALESKSMAITLPVALLIWDAWPLGRFRAGGTLTDGPAARGLALEKAPLFAAGAAVAWLTGRASDAVSGGLTPSPWPFGTELANAAIQYREYAVQTVLPHRLAVLYPLEPHPDPRAVVLSAAALTAVTVLAVMGRRRAPYLLAGWAWFLVTLLPVIGLVPAGPMSPADRYMYLPVLGLLVMITWGAADLLARRRVAPRLVAAASLVALAAASRVQMQNWATPDALFARARVVNPRNPLVYRELALLAVRRGDDAAATALEKEALAIEPRFADAHYDLGLIFASQGQFESAAGEFREAVRIKPSSALSWYHLGEVLERLGNGGESATCLARARALDPSVDPRAARRERVPVRKREPDGEHDLGRAEGALSIGERQQKAGRSLDSAPRRSRRSRSRWCSTRSTGGPGRAPQLTDSPRMRSDFVQARAVWKLW